MHQMVWEAADSHHFCIALETEQRIPVQLAVQVARPALRRVHSQGECTQPPEFQGDGGTACQHRTKSASLERLDCSFGTGTGISVALPSSRKGASSATAPSGTTLWLKRKVIACRAEPVVVSACQKRDRCRPHLS